MPNVVLWTFDNPQGPDRSSYHGIVPSDPALNYSIPVRSRNSHDYYDVVVKPQDPTVFAVPKFCYNTTVGDKRECA